MIEVISFEPDARSDADGKIYRMALGARDDEVKNLYLSQLPAASSFYRHHPEMDHFVVRDWLKITGEKAVPVSTLDCCLKGKPIDFLKIDVEGADLDVLQGAEETLGSVLAIQVEVSFAQRHESAPLFSDIDLFLRERGFQLHTIFHEHWLRENAVFGANSNPQLIWGDAVYLRQEMKEADFAKWVLVLQAFGFHDFAIDRLPEEWHDVIRQSTTSHLSFLLRRNWHLLLATLAMPFFGKRAWIVWKRCAASVFRELYLVCNRTGPKNGIISDG